MLSAVRRGTGATILVVGAAMLLVLVAAPSAIAKTKRFTVGNFQYAEESATIPDAGPAETTLKGATPRCEKGEGWKTTGGGAFPRGLAGHTRLITSGFSDAGEWFADAVHTDSDPKKITVYGVCVRKQRAKPFTDISSVPTGPATPGNSFGCPVDRVVLGGGVRLIGAAEFWALNTNYPNDGLDGDDIPDDAWGADAAWYGPTTTSMLIDVVCGDEQPKYKSAETTLDTIPGDGKTTAKCGSGHITGGGAYISGSVDEAYIVASYPVDGKDADKAPDDGWRAWAENAEGGTKSLTSYAICL